TIKKIVYIGIIVAVLVVFGFILAKNKAKNEAETAIVVQNNSAVEVRTEQVKTDVVSTSFVANGNFSPFQELNFSSENPGRVTQVLVKEGSVVKIGQVLAIIKGDRLSVDVQSAKAAYQTALADSERFNNAFKTGGVTQLQLDQAQLNLATAKARLDQANISFGDASIKSTINGVVNKKYIEPGSVVTSG